MTCQHRNHIGRTRSYLGSDGLAQCVHEANGVVKIFALSPESKVTEIVHRHSASNDQHPFIPQTLQRLTKPVVRRWVLVAVQTELHKRYSQWVSIRIEGDQKPGKDAVSQPALCGLGIDAGLSQPGQYLKTKRCAADRGVLQLVEPGGKAIVATYLSVKSVDHG